MDKILHDPKDPKLWELWYISYNGSCRILSINRSLRTLHQEILNSSSLVNLYETACNTQTDPYKQSRN